MLAARNQYTAGSNVAVPEPGTMALGAVAMLVDDGFDAPMLETVRGKGYRLRPLGPAA